MAVTRTFILDEESAQRLEDMAAATERTRSGMLRWLINAEWQRSFDPEKQPATAPTDPQVARQAA